MKIHTFRAGQQSGPQSLEEVQSKIQSGALARTDLAWYEGASDWIPLERVPGLKFPESAVPPRIKVPPPLPIAGVPFPAAAMPHAHSMGPPPRKGPLIAGAVGAILLALLLFGVGMGLLVGNDQGGLPLLGCSCFP